jgi:hypothetical protein
MAAIQAGKAAILTRMKAACTRNSSDLPRITQDTSPTETAHYFASR